MEYSVRWEAVAVPNGYLYGYVIYRRGAVIKRSRMIYGDDLEALSAGHKALKRLKQKACQNGGR